MSRSSGPAFLLVIGVDALSDKAAGAPLRAFGTLAAIWILARVISWHVPENIVIDPLNPMRGHAATRDVRKILDSGKTGRAGVHPSVPVVPRNNLANKHDTMLTSDPARRLIDPDPFRWPSSQVRFSLMTPQPQFISYAHPSSNSVQQVASLTGGTGSDAPEMHAMSVKLKRPRLNGYFWIFTRRASQANGPEATGSRATISNGQYGGSQVGAILSYPILTSPDPGLAVYGRFSAALAPLAQEELALGIRVHPFDRFPLSIHAEQRLSTDSGGDRGAALYAAGGTGPRQIVEKLELETYIQAGYVLGDDKSHFFDGSATFQRPIIISDRKTLSIGTGVWAGGQRNVARLDLGPRADIRFPLGSKSARIAVDWRVRVAGDAQPKSGVAITLSTGF